MTFLCKKGVMFILEPWQNANVVLRFNMLGNNLSVYRSFAIGILTSYLKASVVVREE